MSSERDFDIIRNNREHLRNLITEFCDILRDPRQDRPVRLTPMQYEIVLNALMNRNVIILAPRGSGKSFALAVAIAMWLCYKKSKECVGIIAPFDSQSRTLFGYVINFFLGSVILEPLIAGLSEERNPHLTLTSGSKLIRKVISPQSDGNSIRSRHFTFVAVDESTFISRDHFEQNVEPIVEYYKAPFINVGTPRFNNNHCYDYMFNDLYSLEDAGENHGFHRLKYTWVEAIIQGEAYDAPYSEDYIKRKEKQWGLDSSKFRSEYLCEFIENR